MISSRDRALRLARAIVSDVVLYNQQALDRGTDGGFRVFEESMREGQALYDSRVAPDLRGENILDRALVDLLGPQANVSPFSIGRLRNSIFVWPHCPVCRAERFTHDRMIAHRFLPSGNWSVLLSCPRCFSVARADAPAGQPAPPEAAVVEYSAAVVARVRERVERAFERGEVRSEVDRLRAERGDALLLGVPEVFSLAKSAFGAQVRLVTDHSLGDPDPSRSSPWPVTHAVLVEPRHDDGDCVRAGALLDVESVLNGQLRTGPPPNPTAGMRGVEHLLVPIGMVNPGERL